MDDSLEATFDKLYSHPLKDTNDTISATQVLPLDSDVDDESHPKGVFDHAAIPQRSSILGIGSLTSESMVSRAANQLVVSKIEECIRVIADGLQRQVEVSISLKARKQRAASAPPGNEQGMSETLVRFPGRNAQEAWRFGRYSWLALGITADLNTAVLVRILDLLHESLINNVVVSKRCILSSSWVMIFCSC